jgi:hypothetical protein
MGTITGKSDLDPVRWPNSHWRSVKVKLESKLLTYCIAFYMCFHASLYSAQFSTLMVCLFLYIWFMNAFMLFCEPYRLDGMSQLLERNSLGFLFGMSSHSQLSQCIRLLLLLD